MMLMLLMMMMIMMMMMVIVKLFTFDLFLVSATSSTSYLASSVAADGKVHYVLPHK